MYHLLEKDKAKRAEAVRNYVAGLSIEEKLSQVFMINLERDDDFYPVEWYDRTVTDSNNETRKIKTTLIPAGYIFFGYNISKDPRKIISFTDSIIRHAAEQNTIPPFLSIDAEGGFVNRLRGIAGPLPENERVSACLKNNEAYDMYSSFAKQLYSLGFNLNLAPVAEINTDSNKEFLSGRSYGTEPQVIEYCTKAVKAYQNNKVGTVLKHFPGNTNIDPHIGLPKIDMSQSEFEQIKKVFKDLISENPDGVLMSHAIVPAFDKDPACLSKFWISDIMRNELKFDGIIFSDDIFMGALIDNGYSPAIASKMAIEAGINCIMISEKKFGRWMNLLISICNEDDLFLSKIEESVIKMIEFKIRHNVLKLDYDKVNDSYHVSLYTPEKMDFSDQQREERFNEFNVEKKFNEDFYKKYFFDTATDEEKRCLYIK